VSLLPSLPPILREAHFKRDGLREAAEAHGGRRQFLCEAALVAALLLPFAITTVSVALVASLGTLAGAVVIVSAAQGHRHREQASGRYKRHNHPENTNTSTHA